MADYSSRSRMQDAVAGKVSILKSHEFKILALVQAAAYKNFAFDVKDLDELRAVRGERVKLELENENDIQSIKADIKNEALALIELRKMEQEMISMVPRNRADYLEACRERDTIRSELCKYLELSLIGDRDLQPELALQKAQIKGLEKRLEEETNAFGERDIIIKQQSAEIEKLRERNVYLEGLKCELIRIVYDGKVTSKDRTYVSRIRGMTTTEYLGLTQRSWIESRDAVQARFGAQHRMSYFNIGQIQQRNWKSGGRSRCGLVIDYRRANFKMRDGEPSFLILLFVVVVIAYVTRAKIVKSQNPM